MAKGTPIPVKLFIKPNKSFTFIIKTPPAAYLIKEAIKLAKGSQTPGRDVVGKINHSQIVEICKNENARFKCL